MRPPQGPAAQEAAQPRREVVDDDLRADIGRAWESLLDHSDAIADDITLTLMENGSKYYDAVGPELRADVRANTREHIRRGIRTMAGLADPEEKAIHIWRETGRRRARQGVPMELVLNAYSLGTRMLWEALLEQRNNPDLGIDDHVLLIAGQRIWSALDVHIERGPDPLPGYQEDMVVDAQVGVVPLLEERLPQHPGSEAVGVEDQLHRDPLPGPAAAGLPPDVDRLLLRVGESRHGADTPADVLPGVGPNVRAQIRPDCVVVLAAVLHQRERDVVGDRVGMVEQ